MQGFGLKHRVKSLSLADLKRYDELNAIREHGVFTYDEQEEWIALCTRIFKKLLKDYEKELNISKENGDTWILK